MCHGAVCHEYIIIYDYLFQESFDSFCYMHFLCRGRIDLLSINSSEFSLSKFSRYRLYYIINIKINKYENRRAISRSLRRYRKYEKETVSRSLNFHRIHENMTVKCLSNDVHEFNSRYNFEVSTRNRQVSDIDLPFFSFFFFLSPEVTELHTRWDIPCYRKRMCALLSKDIPES